MIDNTQPSQSQGLNLYRGEIAGTDDDPLLARVDDRDPSLERGEGSYIFEDSNGHLLFGGISPTDDALPTKESWGDDIAPLLVADTNFGDVTHPRYIPGDLRAPLIIESLGGDNAPLLVADRNSGSEAEMLQRLLAQPTSEAA